MTARNKNVKFLNEKYIMYICDTFDDYIKLPSLKTDITVKKTNARNEA